jgi:hypothetical protein
VTGDTPFWGLIPERNQQDKYLTLKKEGSKAGKGTEK